jgi:hypothetical protein
LKMSLKSFVAGVFPCLLAIMVSAAETNRLAIIPWPQKVTVQAGAFRLTPDTRVYVDFASRRTGEFLAARLRSSTGYPFSTRLKLFSGKAVKNGIVLTTAAAANPHLGAEGYALTVTPDSIIIRANLVPIIAAGNFFHQPGDQCRLADARGAN